MADGNVIDSLSIELSASVDKSISAVDDLQQKLDRLNGALAKFTDSGEHKKALDNLSNGFEKLGKSVNLLDPDKITAVSASLKTLASAASKMQSAYGSLSGGNKGITSLSKDMKEQGKTLSNEFGISGANNIQAVTSAFEELADATKRSGKNTAEYVSSFSKLVGVLREASNFKGMTDGSGSIAQQVRDYVSQANKANTKVYLPFEPSEFADNYSSMRSTFGKMFTSDDMALFEGAQDIAEFAKEMNGALGEGTIDLGDGSYMNGNEADIFRQIYEYLVKAKTEQEDLTKSAQQYAISEQDVANAVDTLLPKIQALNEVNTGTTGDGEGSIAKVATELRSLDGIKLPDFSQLGTLGTAVQKISQGGDAAVSNLPIIADSVKTLYSSFEGATIPDFTQIGVLGTAISKLGSDSAKNASTVLPNITAELESFATHFKDISIDNGSLDTIQRLGSAFSKLGGKNANEAIAVLPQMGDAIRNIVEDLNSLPEVSDKTVQLVTALGNLAKANTSVGKSMESLNGYSGKTKSVFEGLKSAVKGVATSVKSELVSSFKQGYQASLTLGNGMKAASGHAQSLTMAIVKIRTLFWGLRQLASFFSGAIENASSLTEVQNVIQHVYDPSYLETFNKASENTIQTLGMSKLSFQTFASRYQAMGKAMGITNSQMQAAESHLQSMGIEYGTASGKMADMSLNLTQLAADMASFYDVDVSDVYTSLQAIYTGQTRPLNVAA